MNYLGEKNGYKVYAVQGYHIYIDPSIAKVTYDAILKRFAEDENFRKQYLGSSKPAFKVNGSFYKLEWNGSSVRVDLVKR